MVTINLEGLSRQLCLTMQQQLPAALGVVHAAKIAEDTAWFGAVGMAYVDTLLPAPVTWDVGHNEMLLNLPLEQWPVFTVAAYEADADADMQGENWDVMAHIVEFETWLYDPDASAVNRKAWRYGEAITIVLGEDPTLGGVALPVQRPPNVIVSQSTSRYVEEFREGAVYVQGVRVTHTYQIPTLL